MEGALYIVSAADGLLSKISSASASDVLAILAIIVSWFAIVRANKGASASSLLAIVEAFRARWQDFLGQDDEEKRDGQFADLLNLVETACAIDADRAFTGTARELLREYLDQIFVLFDGNEYARQKMVDLVSGPNTFKYIKLYKRRRCGWRKRLCQWLQCDAI